MKSDWFRTTRINWIMETIQIYGFINREHIVKKFGISTVQASIDLREVRAKWPDHIEYDLSTKRYVYKANPHE